VFESFDSDVHAYLRALAGDRAPRVGPFVLLLDTNDAGPYRNYAVPDDGAEPTPADIDALIAAFAGAPEATEHDVARLRGTLGRGGLVALAVDTATGIGVGGGLCAPPHLSLVPTLGQIPRGSFRTQRGTRADSS
jgi:hypothetical protein